jgi:hypothetical protein
MGSSDRMPFIRSNRLSGASYIDLRLMAEALFTLMSIAPNWAIWSAANVRVNR